MCVDSEQVSVVVAVVVVMVVLKQASEHINNRGSAPDWKRFQFQLVAVVFLGNCE